MTKNWLVAIKTVNGKSRQRALMSLLSIYFLAPLPTLAACLETYVCKQPGEGPGTWQSIITLDPNTGAVWIDSHGITHNFEQELVDFSRGQQGWHRWSTHANKDGTANSWTELNTNTGVIQDIQFDKVTYRSPSGTCLMRTR